MLKMSGADIRDLDPFQASTARPDADGREMTDRNDKTLLELIKMAATPIDLDKLIADG
jgi:hypothetical protein